MTETKTVYKSEKTSLFPARHAAPWESEEFHKLLEGIELGLTVAELADSHQRTPKGIRSAVRRLLPPALLLLHRYPSVEVFARYLSETKDIDRQALIHAACPRLRTRKVVKSLPETTILTVAKVSTNADCTHRDNQSEEFVANAESLVYDNSDANVIMLVSAAAASLPKERHRDVLEMRLGREDKPLTLAEIGAEWGVSRERVRQIQERAFSRLAGQARLEGTPGAALKKMLALASTSPEEIAKWVLSAVSSDFVIPARMAAKFILHTAGFSKAKAAEIEVLLPALVRSQKCQLRELCRSHAAAEKIESIISDWLKYSDWPSVIAPPPLSVQLSTQRVVNDSDIAGNFHSQKLGREVQYESGLELNILTLLERSERVAYYQEQPAVIPYTFKGRERKYYPDLFVATVDGRGLLVEVKPTDSMALSINRAKANAGRAWAHARGWGWLVVNDRCTLRQVEEHSISPSKWGLLDTELKARGVLTWSDVLTLREQHNITRLDFIAYIIQSGAELDRGYRIRA